MYFINDSFIIISVDLVMIEVRLLFINVINSTQDFIVGKEFISITQLIISNFPTILKIWRLNTFL